MTATGAESSGEASDAEADRGDNGGWQQNNRPEARRDERQNGGQGRDDRRGERNFNRDDRPRDDRPRDDRPRDERPRDDRPRDERPRDDRPRDDRPRDDRPRDERPRDDRQRDERPREDRFRDDRSRNDRNDRPREDRRPDRVEAVRDPLAVVEPQARPLTAETEQPTSPVLRSQDGGFSEAPAFLQARGEPAADTAVADEQRPRARRRRAPK